MKKIKNTFIYIIFVVVSLIIFYILIAKEYKSNTIEVNSDLLDLHISVPSYYEVTRRFHILNITNDKGEITISRYGSFFDNLDDHLKDLSNKNNVEIQILEKIPSDEYQIYKVKFDKGANTKPEDISYLILTRYTIYTFQANSEALYPDLDAIAKSFRYNP